MRFFFLNKKERQTLVTRNRNQKSPIYGFAQTTLTLLKNADNHNNKIFNVGYIIT